MDISEALEYIHSCKSLSCRPGLERIGYLCEGLGNPQECLKIVHVAGTNGKGSFCAMLECILRAAGYRVGLFTSPYICSFNERFRVDGTPIDDGTLAEICETVKSVADTMSEPPVEFEIICAIGFEYFKREKCDIVVLEAGLGGRFDATNIIKAPLLSVITGVALDHMAILGDTVEKIASEKAGIIKHGVPVLYGGTDACAASVIRERAGLVGADYFSADRDALYICRATLDGTDFSYRERRNLKIKLLGAYQPENASTVIDAVDILRIRGTDIPESAIVEGLASASWHARFELLSRDPVMIFDGAHNEQGIYAAIESIRMYFGNQKVLILTGVMRDKNYSRMAELLSEMAEKVYTVTPDNPRALDAREYAEVFRRCGAKADAFLNVAEALSCARNDAQESALPLVCLGSLYLYHDIISNI